MSRSYDVIDCSAAFGNREHVTASFCDRTARF